MRILVVDDEPEIGFIVAGMLRRVGYEVATAESGEAAWELFQRDRFEMVITDLAMPGMDGLDLIRNIRAAGRDGYTYILILTVLTDPKYVISGHQAGADDYLTKPIDTLELLARVKLGERFLNLEERLREALRRAGENSAASSA
jgi:sigma-B regulation protein RsbU (phosphoserine phosphatase)